MEYQYGTFSIPFTNRESGYLDFDLPEVDAHRDLAVLFAEGENGEILEGPPGITTEARWLGEPAQIWKYPARRRA